MKDWEGVREEVSVLAGSFMFYCCLLRAVVTVVMTLLLFPLSAKKHALAQTKKLYSIQNERNNCVQIVLRVPYFPLITCTRNNNPTRIFVRSRFCACATQQTFQSRIRLILNSTTDVKGFLLMGSGVFHVYVASICLLYG